MPKRAQPVWCASTYVAVERSARARWIQYATCPTCGRRIALTKAGTMRQHVPVTERSTS